MITFRITFRYGKLDASLCPPSWITEVFPAFDGWPVTLSESECIVEAPAGTVPVDSPLLRIETISN